MNRFLRPLFRTLSEGYGWLARITRPLLALPPLRLTFMITTRCNLSCPFCSLQGQLNRKEEDRLSPEEWVRLIRTIPRRTVVMISGGEPFLAPAVVTILGELLRTGHLVSVVTNGTVLDEETASFLVRQRLYYLMVSLDGMASYHNRLRGMPHAFERIARFFAALNAAKRRANSSYPLTCIKTTVTEDNHAEIPELLRFAEKTLQADHLALSLLTDTALQQSFELTESLSDPRLRVGNRYRYSAQAQQQILAMLTQLEQYRKKSRLQIELAPRFQSAEALHEYLARPEKVGVRQCVLPWTELTVHYNGDISPCIGYRLTNVRDVDYHLNRIGRHPRYCSFLAWYARQRYLPVCQGCCWGHHDLKKLS
ncbi:MAG: radical SAM protein [Kiritimatiellia bacterium]